MNLTITYPPFKNIDLPGKESGIERIKAVQALFPSKNCLPEPKNFDSYKFKKSQFDNEPYLIKVLQLGQMIQNLHNDDGTENKLGRIPVYMMTFLTDHLKESFFEELTKARLKGEYSIRREFEKKRNTDF